MIAYASAADIRRWEAEDRGDILSVFRKGEHIWAGDRIIDSDGSVLTSCSFLGREKDLAVCLIYVTRPLVCRNYVPGSSEICSQFYAGVKPAGKIK